MKLINFLIIFTTLVVSSCHNPQIVSGIPSCIYKEINQLSKAPESFYGSVKEYQFQGRMVYAFEPDTRRIADGTTMVKDPDCNTLCHVGGFAGPSNNQCAGGNFFKDAVYKRTVWEKK